MTRQIEAYTRNLEAAPVLQESPAHLIVYVSFQLSTEDCCVAHGYLCDFLSYRLLPKPAKAETKWVSSSKGLGHSGVGF